MSKHNTPRFYLVINNKSNIIRRNSSHLKKTNTEFEIDKYDKDYENCTMNDKKQETSAEYSEPDEPKIVNKQQQTPKTTRSGRTVKTQAKFKDYIL